MQDHPRAGKQGAALPRPRAAERLLPPLSDHSPRRPRPGPRRTAAASAATATRPASPRARRPAAPYRAASALATVAAQ